jgi:ribosomal protein S18 acetylase RimI-like enzyme
MNDVAGLAFAPIDLARHAPLCVSFRRDMYVASFGTEAGLEEEMGPEGVLYLAQLTRRLEQLPEGNAHLWRHGEIAGQAEMSLLEEEPGVGYVHLFYVAPAHRGQGLGRLLHQHAAAVFTQRGMRAMRLSVGARNERAIGFYQALGWRRAGDRPHREPMHVMECRL